MKSIEDTEGRTFMMIFFCRIYDKDCMGFISTGFDTYVKQDEHSFLYSTKCLYFCLKTFGEIVLPYTGNIFADTLKEILRELDNKLTEDDINNIIEEVDEDGSGTLDFDGMS